MNRQEGYEVLRFLSRHCNSVADALQAERMLQDLPGNLRSHTHVIQWLNANWSRYTATA